VEASRFWSAGSGLTTSASLQCTTQVAITRYVTLGENAGKAGTSVLDLFRTRAIQSVGKTFIGPLLCLSPLPLS
jgi:hypothetical protein